MMSFAHTGSTFEKLLQYDICRIKSSIHLRKLRINIVYSSGEFKFFKFQLRPSRIPEVLWKDVEACVMQNLVLYSLAQTTH